MVGQKKHREKCISVGRSRQTGAWKKATKRNLHSGRLKGSWSAPRETDGTIVGVAKGSGSMVARRSNSLLSNGKTEEGQSGGRAIVPERQLILGGPPQACGRTGSLRTRGKVKVLGAVEHLRSHIAAQDKGGRQRPGKGRKKRTKNVVSK